MKRIKIKSLKRIYTKKVQCLLFLMLLTVTGSSQVKKEVIFSKQTGDSYDIIIRKPLNFDSSKAYHIVYFTDAGINSGKTILTQPEEKIKQCILVGIGHRGDWKMKRQRDFIPSDAGAYNSKTFAQASKFYLFLKEELIPLINKRYIHKKNSVFIGHSFGGLMALYISLKENNLFDHYYAISPSVWANYYELMKIEKNYSLHNKELNSSISIYAGSLEFLNKVLSSSKDFYDVVMSRNYKGITISHRVISGVNHYGIVPKLIPEIFEKLK